MARTYLSCPECEAPAKPPAVMIMGRPNPGFSCPSCGFYGSWDELKRETTLTVYSPGAGGGSISPFEVEMLGKWLIDNTVAQSAIVTTPTPINVGSLSLLVVAAGCIDAFTPVVVKLGVDTLTTVTEDVGACEGGFYVKNGGFTSTSPQTISVEPATNPPSFVGIVAYGVRGAHATNPIDQSRSAVGIGNNTFSTGATSVLDSFNELAFGLLMGAGSDDDPAPVTYARGFIRDAIMHAGHTLFTFTTARRQLQSKAAVICSGTDSFSGGNNSSVITIRPR